MSKNRVIVEAVLAGQSRGSVARQYGISTVWVGKLVARWRAGGWDAVEKKGDVPLSGGFSLSRSGQCSDHAYMSSGGVTCPSAWAVGAVTRAMVRSEK